MGLIPFKWGYIRLNQVDGAQLPLGKIQSAVMLSAGLVVRKCWRAQYRRNIRAIKAHLRRNQNKHVWTMNMMMTDDDERERAGRAGASESERGAR